MNMYSEQFRSKFMVLGNKDMKVKKYVVENGIISCKSFFVPIRNAAIVSKHAETYSVNAPIIMIFFGVILSLVSALRAFGAMILFAGVVLLAVILIFARTRRYYVKVKLTCGDIFYIRSRDEEFIDKTIEILRNTVSDSQTTYVINTENNVIQYLENHGVINKGDSNWVTMYKSGDKISAEVKNTMNNGHSSVEGIRNAADRNSTKEFQGDEKESGLSDMEWRQLMSYTGRIMNGMNEDDLSYIVLEQLRSNIKQKDKSGAAKTIRMMKKDQLAKFLNSARSDEERNSIMRIVKKVIN